MARSRTEATGSVPLGPMGQPTPAGTSTTRDIAASGWKKSPKPELAGEPNDSTNSWTCYNTYGSKRGENYWRKVASITSLPSSARFPPWVLFAPPWR